ncbi:MAG: hypothetical protein Q4Q62_05635 [Thermoplasmata archaeon]|nr:hypothetical protein [Thermoplasmata archaeon]
MDAAEVCRILDADGKYSVLHPDMEIRLPFPQDMHILVGDTVYFACCEFRSVIRNIKKDPNVTVFASAGPKHVLRCRGTAVLTKDEDLLAKLREAYPDTTREAEKDCNLILFYFEDGEADVIDGKEYRRDLGLPDEE